MMLKIRSHLFNIYFYCYTAFICSLCSPFLFTNCKRVAFVGRYWYYGLRFGLKYLANINIEIEGREHLPKDGNYIVAAKHQSVIDTAIFLSESHAPVYVLKQELLNVPLFGSYIRAMNMIPIDRSAGRKSIKQLQNDAKDRLNNDQNIIIFPEGTRTIPGDKVKYQSGIALLYSDVDVPIIPAALNSGIHWQRKSVLMKPGTIKVKYLPPIEKGLKSKEFLNKLSTAIETESEKLYEY